MPHFCAPITIRFGSAPGSVRPRVAAAPVPRRAWVSGDVGRRRGARPGLHPPQGSAGKHAKPASAGDAAIARSGGSAAGSTGAAAAGGRWPRPRARRGRRRSPSRAEGAVAGRGSSQPAAQEGPVVTAGELRLALAPGRDVLDPDAQAPKRPDLQRVGDHSTGSGGSGVPLQRRQDAALELLARDAEAPRQGAGPRHRERLQAKPEERSRHAREPGRTRGEGAARPGAPIAAVLGSRAAAPTGPRPRRRRGVPRATARHRGRRWPGAARRAARASPGGARRPGAPRASARATGRPGPLVAEPDAAAARRGRARAAWSSVSRSIGTNTLGTRKRISSWNAL